MGLDVVSIVSLSNYRALPPLRSFDRLRMLRDCFVAKLLAMTDVGKPFS
jgi:hypothetical protein